MSIEGINVVGLGRSTINNFTFLDAPNVVLVTGSGNLPLPINSLYQLSGNTIYQFATVVPVGPYGFNLGEATVLLGNAFRVDGFNSTYTGSVINSTNKTIGVHNIFINCPSGQAFNITSTGANRAIVQDTQISGCSGLGTISGINALSLQDNRIFLNKDGIKIFGPSSFIRVVGNRINQGVGPNFTGLSVFGGGGNIGTIDIQGNTSQIDSANQVALFVESGSTITGLVSNNAIGGTGIFLSGIIKADVNWKFSSNSTFPDSAKVGSINLSGNTSGTTFTATNQFVSISGYSRTGQAMERFTMPTSGTFQYIGLEPCQIHANFIGYYTVASALTINMGFAFAKNGIVIGDAYYEGNTTSASTPASIALNGVLNLVTNDTLAVYITNRTNTIAAVVAAYNFTVQ